MLLVTSPKSMEYRDTYFMSRKFYPKIIDVNTNFWLKSDVHVFGELHSWVLRIGFAKTKVHKWRNQVERLATAIIFSSQMLSCETCVATSVHRKRTRSKCQGDLNINSSWQVQLAPIGLCISHMLFSVGRKWITQKNERKLERFDVRSQIHAGSQTRVNQFRHRFWNAWTYVNILHMWLLFWSTGCTNMNLMRHIW